MYFWKIDKLKNDLIERPLTERETLPYIIAVAVVLVFIIELIIFGYSFNDGTEATPYGIWDFANAIFNIVVTVLVTIWLFKLNSVRSENYFLQRYTALGWLVMLRTSLFFMLVIFALFFVAEIMQIDALNNFLDSAFGIFLTSAAFYCFFYWYFCKHLSDVAQKAKY